MWIQTRVTVRKRLSWVLTSVTLTFDLWPGPFAWTSLLSSVITPESFMMIWWWEHGEKGVTDRRTDGQTDGQTDRLNQSYSCLVAAKNITQFYSKINNHEVNFCDKNCEDQYVMQNLIIDENDTMASRTTHANMPEQNQYWTRIQATLPTSDSGPLQAYYGTFTGTHFTDGSWAHNWNCVIFSFALILILMIQSGHNFAHATAVQLIGSLFFKSKHMSFMSFGLWAYKFFVKCIPGLIHSMNYDGVFCFTALLAASWCCWDPGIDASRSWCQPTGSPGRRLLHLHWVSGKEFNH